MGAVLFYVFAIIAVLAAFLVIVFRNPINCALSMVVCFFALAAIYVLLSAHLIAVLQILVYAGAIMVLVLFVIMLMNLRERELGRWEFTWPKIIGFILAGLFLIEGINFLKGVKGWNAVEISKGFGTVEAVGTKLFSRYLLPFEMVSILLLIGIIGAVVLTKKKIGE
ncbi:MAG: NADH-quinone oxidoreductase subunit J [bacterium]